MTNRPFYIWLLKITLGIGFFAFLCAYAGVKFASASGDYFGFDSYNTGNLNGQDSWYAYPPIPTLDSQQITTVQYQSSANSSRGGMASGYAWSGHHFTAPLSAFSFYWRGVNNTNLGDVEFASDFSTRANSVRLYKTNNDLNCILRENGTNKSAVLIDTSFFDSTFKQITMSMTGYQIYINGVSCGTFSSSSYWNTIDEIGLYYPGTGTDQYYIDTISINGGSPLPPAPTVPAQPWNAEGHEAIFDVTCNATGELWYDFTGSFTKYADCTSGVATEVQLYKETLSETPVTVNFQTRNGNGNSASAPYSVTFAPFSAPTVPAPFSGRDTLLIFDVTCNQAGELWRSYTSDGNPPVYSWAQKVADCDIDEAVPQEILLASVPVGEVVEYNFDYYVIIDENDESAVGEFSYTLDLAGFVELPVPANPNPPTESIVLDQSPFVTWEGGFSDIFCMDMSNAWKYYSSQGLMSVSMVDKDGNEEDKTFYCRRQTDQGQSDWIEYKLFWGGQGSGVQSVSFPDGDKILTTMSPYELVVKKTSPAYDLYCSYGEVGDVLVEDYLDTTTAIFSFPIDQNSTVPVTCWQDDDYDIPVLTRVIRQSDAYIYGLTAEEYGDIFPMCSTIMRAENAGWLERAYMATFGKMWNSLVTASLIGDARIVLCWSYYRMIDPILAVDFDDAPVDDWVLSYDGAGYVTNGNFAFPVVDYYEQVKTSLADADGEIIRITITSVMWIVTLLCVLGLFLSLKE